MRSTFENLDGESVQEKFAGLGITPGERIDILEIQRLGQEYGFRAVLYFEEEMGRNGDLAADEKAYKNVPETERPFISVDGFLKYAREYDPYSFELRLKDLPIIIEVATVGEIKGEPYMAGLMPFLDDLEDFEEPEVIE
ncbi:hypothetical protein RJ40_02915 [Methanofollis aquaemaris]|uniref:Uncharacterized protein n=1 Tax=Methanofollis aquaemaris TaxID=126734 RepID=A0A8A3S311_9EURY|nr:hypothetical protein [Methanofollis aquaemaris]QSZ66525.1 hypothetical protein RJ40_02915 [Methanofollis aquaemaris]